MPSPTSLDHTFQETALEATLTTLLSDPDLSDLTLEGTDGEKVKANRCILATRSTVFRRMFLGQYSEATSSDVQIGFEGKTLRAIVEYCYTDHASFFDQRCDDSWARAAVQLAIASDYFQLPGLSNTLSELVRCRMANEPMLAVAIFGEAQHVGDAARGLRDVAMAVIRSRTREVLLRPALPHLQGVAALRPSALEMLLKDNKMSTDELTMFRALKQWANSDAPWEDHQFETRHRVASKLSANITLTGIKPSDLCGVVAPSGLVTEDQLAEAFKAQALLFEKMKVLIPTCRGPCWEVSNDLLLECKEARITTSCLQCKPMKSGVHTWAIEILRSTNERNGYDEIGVACKIKNREGWLSNRENTAWVYVQGGRAYHAGKGHCVEAHWFKTAGSVISVTLDLTASGSLAIQVDGKDVVHLYDNMLDGLDADEQVSFVPAVSLHHQAAVRFLGFEGHK